MLVFIIPVKSAKVALDWKYFCRLFERSLGSICQQTNSQFEVVAVCHEIPSINFEHPKIHYVSVDFPPPIQTDIEESDRNAKREIDKSKKIFAGAKHAEQFNPDYIMIVDSDDCINNEISKFVNSNTGKDIPGWFVKKGYVYSEGESYISLNRSYFNVLCGTSTIIKPEFLPKMFREVPHLMYEHSKTKLSNTQKLNPLPFPGAIYSMANGENHYMSQKMVRSLNDHSKLFSLTEIKRFYKKLNTYRSRLLDKSLKSAFNLYEIS